MNRFTPEQDAERLALCGVTGQNMGGGIAHFSCTPAALAELVAKGYADPRQTQNDSPSIGDFLAWVEGARDASGVRFDCYVVSNDRGDRRVSVEGLTLGSDDLLAQVEFLERFGHADESDRSFAWWD